jgi:hypothetical protein
MGKVFAVVADRAIDEIAGIAAATAAAATAARVPAMGRLRVATGTHR